MPSCPRGEIVRRGEVAVYYDHCWNRCVRRALLCGQDQVTGMDYEYRREWIRQIRENLAGLFAIEIAIEISFHAKMWTELVTRFDGLFGHIVVTPEEVTRRAREAGRRWYQGVANCARAFG